MMNKIKAIALAVFLAGIFSACSHDYKSDTLDLGFYQWNFWPEEGASSDDHAPSCGWDDMHRGVGKLVRIPATVGDHFSPDYSGVSWYHVRFTLPELWEGRKVSLQFEGVNGNTEVFLDGKPAGVHPLVEGPFSLDLSEQIFYTRDNHMCIRVTDPRPGQGGITGKVILKAS